MLIRQAREFIDYNHSLNKALIECINDPDLYDKNPVICKCCEIDIRTDVEHVKTESHRKKLNSFLFEKHDKRRKGNFVEMIHSFKTIEPKMLEDTLKVLKQVFNDNDLFKEIVNKVSLG